MKKLVAIKLGETPAEQPLSAQQPEQQQPEQQQP
jgi:hypothetical protein